MTFRLKIWMLPLCATLVFVIGVAISVLVGLNSSKDLSTLRLVQSPHLELLLRVDRGVESFRQTLQSAAAEGDASKIKDTDAVVTSIRESLKSISALQGHEADGQALLAAFNTYRDVSVQAVSAMLNSKDAAELTASMQSAQMALDKLYKEKEADARTAIAASFATVDKGMAANIWVGALTGLITMIVLGVASKVIVASVWKDLGGEPKQLRSVAHQVAEGDLVVHAGDASGDKDSLNGAMKTMVSRLSGTILSIQQATETIATASTEIAQGNQDLSSRTEHTASNLQETASSIERLAQTVHHSADSARQASVLATNAMSAAEGGGQIVARVVDNMNDINAASRQINEIIGVIDAIAFQTNILALNAAVEAARAGEQGRGFSVVAGEVRSLAQRCAQAAREIKDLIKSSGLKVQSGAQLVADAGAAMQDIVASVGKVGEMIREISETTTEQAQGISQVNTAVDQLDRMTQQNAALVEQSAAAAESLREQTSRLTQAMSTFRVAPA